MRFHKIANVNKALDFIASKGVKLVSIGAEGRNVYVFIMTRQLIRYRSRAIESKPVKLTTGSTYIE